MISIRLALVTVLSVAAIACGSDSSSPSSPSPTPTPTPTPTPGGAATAVTIPSGAQILGDRAFSPDTIDISAGSTVTWTNSDSVSHTSTSNAAGWDSGIIAPGRQFSFTFQNAGTFQYHCAIHPGMVGSVVVH
jgi:plastocyanin